MSHPKNGRLRAAAALLVGGALALTGAGVATAANTATIDSTKTASLTIHKYEQPAAATGLANDGRELSATELTGLTALSGVEFTIQQVPGVDLTTNAGWETATAMTTDAAATAVASVTGTKGTTATDGTLSFGSLPLGLYYVSETSTPAGVTAAAPFLVTLPLTNPVDSASWLYDVHVYPKNFAANTDKTVEDASSIAVGDDVNWSITSTIPADGTDGFQMSDTLDKKLDYKSVSVSIGGTALTATTDYTVATKVGSTTGRTTVSVQLTAAGLVKANAAKGSVIQFDLVTTVNAVGEIANVAEIYNNADDITNKTPSDYTPGHPDEDNPTPIPDDNYDPQPDPTDPTVPTTKFGEATLSKVDAANSATVLAGAEFQVYTSEADAKAGTNPVTIGGVSTWTSGADGKVSISGLRYSNWENGAEITATADWQHYWLVETKSPTGYELLAAPVQFDVTSNDATVIDLTVKNSAADAGFTLPLTGGTGIALLMIGGTALVVGAVLIGTRRRKVAVTA